MSTVQEQRPLEIDLPQSVVQPRILTPMLCIFPGSTGAYAALELMNHAKGLSESDRKRMSFVYIDTDGQPPELVTFRNEYGNLFQEHIIRIAVPPGIRYIPRITQGGDPREPHTYAGDKMPEYFSTGARGVRNNGHVAACHEYKTIKDEIDQALGQITGIDANGGRGISRTVQVNIAAFIGGGTASGIIADLACMMREILIKGGYEQRINLMCMLPTDTSDSSDIGLRQSNSVACLLEMLALGMAAKGGYYEKYMRSEMQRLSNDPIANEVFLIGSAGLRDPKEIARIMGLDLFMRAADASGVGALEQAEWVNRVALGDADDRGLPCMFGTSCPVEVRFPAQETAQAFAQIAASQLLPLLAGYKPEPLRITEGERERWQKEWRMVARAEANNANDPQVVLLPEFKRPDFNDLDAEQIEILWNRMRRMTQEVDARVAGVMKLVRERELARIRMANEGQTTGRVQYWQTLLAEYQAVLEDMKEQGMPALPERPTDLENRALKRRLIMVKRDPSGELFDEYSSYLMTYAEASRYRQLKVVLEEMCTLIETKLNNVFSWASRVNPVQQAPRLRRDGETSAAWKGVLDRRHPLQHHIFDLPMLRTLDGHNIAVERLYAWATAGNGNATVDEIDYHPFLNRCIAYITGSEDIERLHQQSAARLAQRVVSFFQQYYVERFQDTNLFELMEHALPEQSASGKSLDEQIEQVFAEQMGRMHSLMIELVTFDQRVGGEKCVQALKKQVFLGYHYRDGQQKSIIDQIVSRQAFRSKGEFQDKESFDPHRLQLFYSEHAISLSTIPDFYYDRNSAMEQYRRYQQEWQYSNRQGPRPPHACSELERLVTDADALGYQDPQSGSPVSLVDRVLRLP